MSDESDYNEDLEPTEEEVKEEQDSILDILGFDAEVEEEEEVDENEETDEEESEEEEEVETTDTEETDDNEESSDDESEEDPEDEGEEGAESDDDPEEIETPDSENELPPDELTELREANAKLLKLIESGVSASIGVTPKKTDPPETPPANSEENEEVPDLAELIGDIDFNDMQADPSKFVELMQKVVDHTRQSTINGLQADLPTIVNERATQAINTQNLVNDFYRDNSDLAVVKKTVSAVAQNIGAENPTWDMKQILAEAATQTRSILGTKAPSEKAKAKPKRRGKKPALPRVKGKRKKVSGKKVSKQQKQINDIIDY